MSFHRPLSSLIDVSASAHYENKFWIMRFVLFWGSILSSRLFFLCHIKSLSPAWCRHLFDTLYIFWCSSTLYDPLQKKTEDNKELRLSTKSKKKVAAYVFVRVAHMTATTTTHQQGHKSYEQIILNYFLERTTQHMILHDKLNIGKLGTEVHSCIKSGSVFLSHETEASKRACCHASVCVYC